MTGPDLMRLEAEAHWRAPHGAAWIDTYAQSVTNATRAPLRQALLAHRPFRTVLDIGCHCGVLMPIILATQPDAEVTGVDLSAEAVAAARRRWPGHTFVVWALQEYLALLRPYRRFDVVLSSTTLSYVPPHQIAAVLADVTAMTTRLLVIQEPVPTPLFPGEQRTPAGVIEWRYDYETRLSQLGWVLTDRCWHDLAGTRPAATLTFTKDHHGTTTREEDRVDRLCPERAIHAVGRPEHQHLGPERSTLDDAPHRRVVRAPRPRGH